jgi:hypothetical protein
MKDSLKPCPCGKSNACYEQRINSFISAELCWTCGFTTNSLMIDGQKFLKEQFSKLPELYKDIAWKDSKNRKWIPKVVNIQNQGMVFLNGTSLEDVRWSAVLAMLISEEEKHLFPIPGTKEFYTHKMDMTTKKDFDRYDYIGALSYIGVLPPEDENEAVNDINIELPVDEK